MRNKRPPSAPRPTKRSVPEASLPKILSSIRVDRVTLDDDDRVYIRRRLGEMLGKHAASIERATVRVRDINGPRGGVDLMCRIKVVLNTLPSVVVEQKAATFRPAFTRALAGAEQAVRRALQRKRMLPIRSRA